jgi:hypothetical protein
MGGSDTKSTVNVKELNQTDININQETFNKVKNTCEQSTSQKNVLNIVGSKVKKLTTDQKNIAKNACILETALEMTQGTQANNELMTAIKAKLEQQSTAGIGLAKAESNVSIDKQSKFKFNADQKTVNEVISGCITSVDQENVINIIGSDVEDSSFNQVSEDFKECLSKSGVASEQTAKADSKVKSTSDTETTQVAKGMNPLADLMAGLGSLGAAGSAGPIISSCCIFLCCISILAVSLLGGAGGGMPQMPQMSELSDMSPPSY